MHLVFKNNFGYDLLEPSKALFVALKYIKSI